MSEKHGNSEMFHVCLFRETSREGRRVMMLEEEEKKYKRSKQAGKEKAARGAQGQETQEVKLIMEKKRPCFKT